MFNLFKALNVPEAKFKIINVIAIKMYTTISFGFVANISTVAENNNATIVTPINFNILVPHLFIFNILRNSKAGKRIM